MRYITTAEKKAQQKRLKRNKQEKPLTPEESRLRMEKIRAASREYSMRAIDQVRNPVWESKPPEKRNMPTVIPGYTPMKLGRRVQEQIAAATQIAEQQAALASEALGEKVPPIIVLPPVRVSPQNAEKLWESHGKLRKLGTCQDHEPTK